MNMASKATDEANSGTDPDIEVDAQPECKESQARDTTAALRTPPDDAMTGARPKTHRNRPQNIRSDQAYLRYLCHFPPELKEDNIDICIFHAEQDEEDANNLKRCLEEKVTFIIHGKDRHPRVKLCWEVDNSTTTDNLETIFHKSLYIFLYITDIFCSEEWVLFQSNACLMKAIKDTKRCNVIPVLTSERKFKLPVLIDSLRTISWNEKESKCNVRRVKLFLQSRSSSILERDHALHLKRKEYFDKHKDEIRAQHEHAVGGSDDSEKKDTVSKTFLSEDSADGGTNTSIGDWSDDHPNKASALDLRPGGSTGNEQLHTADILSESSHGISPDVCGNDTVSKSCTSGVSTEESATIMLTGQPAGDLNKATPDELRCDVIARNDQLGEAEGHFVDPNMADTRDRGSASDQPSIRNLTEVAEPLSTDMDLRSRSQTHVTTQRVFEDEPVSSEISEGHGLLNMAAAYGEEDSASSVEIDGPEDIEEPSHPTPPAPSVRGTTTSRVSTVPSDEAVAVTSSITNNPSENSTHREGQSPPYTSSVPSASGGSGGAVSGGRENIPVVQHIHHHHYHHYTNNINSMTVSNLLMSGTISTGRRSAQEEPAGETTFDNDKSGDEEETEVKRP